MYSDTYMYIQVKKENIIHNPVNKCIAQCSLHQESNDMHDLITCSFLLFSKAFVTECFVSNKALIYLQATVRCVYKQELGF